MDILRYTVFAAFVGAAAVAVGGWALRTRRLNPFSPVGRALRGLTDPVLKPIEHRLVRSGGNPVNAGWWLFGMTVVGGIVVVSLAQWIAGQVAMMHYAATSGSGLLKVVVYYAGQLLQLAIIVRVFGSWFGVGRFTRWMRPAYVLTDWLIEPLRKIIPPAGMFDVTPIVAWFVVVIVLRVLMGIL